MPRLSFVLVAVIFVCACVNVSKGDNYEPTETSDDSYMLPQTNTEDFSDKSFITTEQVEDDNANDEHPNMSLDAMLDIIAQLGKDHGTGRHLGSESRFGHHPRFFSRVMSKNGEDSKIASQLSGLKQKKAGLSINGALSSLADMLMAEGHRRDHAAAHSLRQRLLVAGRR